MLFITNLYYRSVVFLLLMMAVSCTNDIIAKFIGRRLDSMEVIFFRFFFSCVTLAPFVINGGKAIFKTSNPSSNIIRGILGVVSMYLYTYSIIHLKIVEVITILWTIPLFALVLSKVFLKEHVTVVRWIATIVGFLGLAYLTLYDSATSLTLKWIYIVPTISAFLFAVQDVMIKKMVLQENRVTMLLYFAVVASLFAFPPAILVWKTPTVWEISLLLVLGLFANLIQYFIFKAFESADLSALAPYRYIEFLISALAGFIFFLEIPGLNVVIGATILIPSTLYLAYTEESNC